MKQLLPFSPVFTPGTANNGTLDFSQYPGFNIKSLYAVINITQNQPLYVAGAPTLGISKVVGNVVYLQWPTNTYSTTDILNVYYDVPVPYDNQTPIADNNQAAEKLGNLQSLQEMMSQILVELKLQSYLFANGINNISYEDVEALRNNLNAGDGGTPLD